MSPRWSPAGRLAVRRPGCRLAPWPPRAPLPRTGGFPAGTEPLMWVLNTIRDLIPCEDPVILGTRASVLTGIWVSDQWLTRPGPAPTRAVGHGAPCPHPASETPQIPLCQMR